MASILEKSAVVGSEEDERKLLENIQYLEAVAKEIGLMAQGVYPPNWGMIEIPAMPESICDI